MIAFADTNAPAPSPQPLRQLRQLESCARLAAGRAAACYAACSTGLDLAAASELAWRDWLGRACRQAHPMAAATHLHTLREQFRHAFSARLSGANV